MHTSVTWFCELLARLFYLATPHMWPVPENSNSREFCTDKPLSIKKSDQRSPNV